MFLPNGLKNVFPPLISSASKHKNICFYIANNVNAWLSTQHKEIEFTFILCSSFCVHLRSSAFSVQNRVRNGVNVQKCVQNNRRCWREVGRAHLGPPVKVGLLGNSSLVGVKSIKKLKCWVESEFNCLDCHMSRSRVSPNNPVDHNSGRK